MKNILFSTTALAAVSALAITAGVANAAEKKKKFKFVPLKIGVSGSMHSMAGFGNNDGSFEADSAADVSRETYDSFNMVQDSEVHFTASTTLENGVALSVAIQLEGDQVNKAAASIDASFMKMTGGFGDIRLGSHAGVAATMVHKAPTSGPIGLDTGETNSYVVRPGNNAFLTAAGTNVGGSDAIKLIYISPKFGNALYLAAAYAPSTSNSDGQPLVGGTPGTETQRYEGVISYEDKVGTTDIKADIAYWEDHGIANSSLKAIRGGANIGIGGMTFGFGIKSQSNIDAGKGGTDASDKQKVWDIGLKYAAGDYTVGIRYLEGEAEELNGDDEVSKWNIGGSYKIGEGVTAAAGIYHVEWSDQTTTNADNNSGFAVVAGVNVKF